VDGDIVRIAAELLLRMGLSSQNWPAIAYKKARKRTAMFLRTQSTAKRPSRMPAFADSPSSSRPTLFQKPRSPRLIYWGVRRAMRQSRLVCWLRERRFLRLYLPNNAPVVCIDGDKAAVLADKVGEVIVRRL
jgi:hypothetical protein